MDRALTLQGSVDAALSGGERAQILTIGAGISVEIRDLRFVGGDASPDATGGAIVNLGTLRIVDSILSGNVACAGGAVDNEGSMTIVRSTFANDHTFCIDVGGLGGAILNGGVLSIDRSTLDRDRSGVGGAIYDRGKLTVTNSTFTDDAATGEYFGQNGFGGAIDVANHASVATFSSVTISRNHATTGGGGLGVGGSAVLLGASIVAGNYLEPLDSGRASYDDCSGTVVSTGYDLIGTVADCGFEPDPSGTDIYGRVGQRPVDPLLGPLGDHGGRTETMALLRGSPAIDLIPLTDCLVVIDQRGVARPQGPGCDGGAFEFRRH